MKAERRHDLKDNTLAKRLVEVPSFGKTYGPRIFLGVLILGLVGFIIRNRMQSADLNKAAIASKLIEARENLDWMQRRDQYLAEVFASNMNQVPPDLLEGIAGERKLKFDEGVAAADAVLADSSEKQTQERAQALLDIGDLNWEMANTPALPGATSRPSLQPDKPREALLKDADAAYQRVVSQYSGDTMQTTAARFGIASVAEDLGALGSRSDHTQWDIASEQYKTIIASDASPPLRDRAQQLLNSLPDLEQAPLMNVPSLSSLGPLVGPTTNMSNPMKSPTTSRSMDLSPYLLNGGARPDEIPSTRPGATTKP